ncbi:MAG: MBL fold metallo-hydrolase [Azoarcus sp.]|nr:MBL fold metallo-hydrolase [Azoarcus sp.]
MQYVTAHPDGVLAIDAGYGRDGLAAIHLVIHRGRAAIIDAGTPASVPRVFSALAAAGIAPENVDWVMLTHIHLDHAAGAGPLMAALPQARLLVHPRGVRHLADPQRLWSANAEVYGSQRLVEMYGEPVPVPAERIVAAEEGLRVALGERSFRVLDTPGHTRHHIAIWDETAHAGFVGDTFGVSYRELDRDGHAFVFPSTMPSEFEPDALHRSIDRIASLRPEAIYLGHYSRVTGVDRIATDLHRLIDAQVAIACAARGHGVKRHVEILAGLEQLVCEEVERQGAPVSEEEVLELLRMDLDMNAQGLGMWMDKHPEAVTA